MDDVVIYVVVDADVCVVTLVVDNDVDVADIVRNSKITCYQSTCEFGNMCVCHS